MARFTNQAQLAYRNRITTSNIAVGEILEVLSAAKHAVVETYESYDVITYGGQSGQLWNNCTDRTGLNGQSGRLYFQ